MPDAAGVALGVQLVRQDAESDCVLRMFARIIHLAFSGEFLSLLEQFEQFEATFGLLLLRAVQNGGGGRPKMVAPG